MAFNPLDRLLADLENQPAWNDYQRYQNLCQGWKTVVDAKVAHHTRLLRIQRNVLWVATSSAVWAQTLSLQRYSLLKKLNTLLSSESLDDIRFSSAQWHSSPHLDENSYKQVPQGNIAPLEKIEPVESDAQHLTPQTPEDAFQRWMQIIQQRSQSFPLCPQCHCPTPPDELERWSKCSYCARQHWRENT